ncbi:hypothetical protein GP486_004798 [Trichoglossum hirsutum]|uniref:F-box domain-containing protein n=1 Tax=Trichoglossum hirsutum TaxID=265104 RepID=A0A9P8RNF2_9PEZI|nr:hypothetical protein GP486_004798 [Trichoglossum hirsutum]
MPLTLEGLPYDVLFGIVQYLDFNDFFNLRRQSRQMKSLLSEETICRKVLETHSNHTTEAKLSRDTGQRKIGCQEALDRVHARREAFALAQPVSVSLLGYGATFLYQQGVLCYRVDEPTVVIRVLDIHNSSDVERVIDVANLIGHTVKGDAQCQPGTFTLLNYADDILVCMFEARKLEPWLLAIRVSTGHCLAALELESSQRIFARHNSDYLLFGTHSYTGSHGHREWVISGYNLKEKRLFESNIYLENLVGCDIGLTVAFEIHDGYFYAVSNQTSFEVEEVDWTSFYHGYRFPLKNACRENLKAERWWRRNHSEGPINDSWTDFRLHVDECTGDLLIVEARREWQDGGSDSQRTYYTRVVQFPNKENPEDSFMFDCESSSAGDPHPALPDEQVARLVGEENKPQYVAQRERHPKNVHCGDDGTTGGFILAKTKVRFYNPDANAFLDLVNDPEDPPRDGGFRLRQRLRLRVGSRMLCPPDSRQPYRSRGIWMWPPDRNSKDDDELMELLNALSGDIEGKCDERSLIYMTGDDTQPRAIVLINFDVGINLRSERNGKSFPTQRVVGGAASNPDRASGKSLAVDCRKQCKGKGKWKQRSVSPVMRSPPGAGVPYFREERATYLGLKSLHFRDV